MSAFTCTCILAGTIYMEIFIFRGSIQTTKVNHINILPQRIKATAKN